MRATSSDGFVGGQIVLDGTALPAAISYPSGYWSSWWDEDAEVWHWDWNITDYNTADLTANVGGLASGAHTVTATIDTPSLTGQTYSWSFTVNRPPAIASVSPVAGSNAGTLTPTISATITDEDSDLAAVMIVDGVTVVPSYNASTKTFSYTPPMPYVDSTTHSVSITVTDTHGATGSRSWSFTTRVSPVLASPLPASGATVKSRRPLIGITASDDQAGPLRYKLTLDGTVVFDGQAPQGAWTWATPTDLTNYTTHGVTVEVTDADGNTSSTSWLFQVSANVGYSSASPVPGSTWTTPSGYYIEAQADSAVSWADISVDGRPTGASVSYPIGHWEYEYDYEGSVTNAWYVVDDYTLVQVSGSGLSLTPGTHTATVSVYAASGTSQYSWSFNVEAPPQFAVLTPSNGSQIGTQTPTISARITDDDSALLGVMTLDGGQVTPSYDSATKIFSYTPPAPLADNTDHTVVLTVTDPHGISNTATWTFRPVVGAYLRAPVPAQGAVVTVPRPAIGLTATDPLPGPLSLRLALDGSTVFTGDVAQGPWTWTPPSDLAQDATHTVDAEVTDANSNTRTLHWTFRVATPAVFSLVTPANGSTVNPPASVSVRADAQSDITGALVTIDGTPRETSVSYPVGYDDMYWDPNDETWYSNGWVVTDASVADIVGTAGSLGQGSHHVEVRVDTASSGSSTYSWDFNTELAPTVTSVTPAAGSTLSNLAPTISATFTDDDSAFTATMTVDGTKVTPTYDSGSKTYTYTPTTPLADNTDHVASILITDPHGYSGTKTWTFRTHVYPWARTPIPADGSTVNSARPPIGLTVSDSGTAHLPLKVTLDGKVIFDGSVAQGPWTWTPDSDFAPGSTHSVVAEVTGIGGLKSELRWSFSAGPATMSSPECASCHPNFPADHPMGNCYGCHGRYHNSPPCENCHWEHQEHSSSYLEGADCTGCHTHSQAQLDSGHSSATTGCYAAGCHDRNLIAEHNKYPSNSWTRFDCMTCHNSSDSRVSGAIAAGDTRCVTCHGDSADHLTIHASTFIDPSCARCHADNLITEHISKRKLTCATCHGDAFALSGAQRSTPSRFSSPAGTLRTTSATGSPVMLTAVSADLGGVIAAGDTTCGACHAEMPHGIRTDCETCHGAVPTTTNGTEPTSAPVGAYLAWNAGGANASTPTPHKGYQTATTKCGVCHAVHDASTAGEVLLRGTVGGSCVYCHIDTSIGGVVLYGGDSTLYTGISTIDGHFRTNYSACVNCHSVHGAQTLAGASNSKILWDWTTSGRSTYSTPALAVWPNPATVANHDEQITAWCTGCHPNYTRSYNETIQANSFDHVDGYTWVVSQQKSHVMTDLAGGYDDPASTVPPGTQVAWVGSEYCRSCHDAGQTNEGPGVHSDSFPHYTAGYTMFMTVGGSVESSMGTNDDPHVDGLCLKCHRSGAEGVGLTY